MSSVHFERGRRGGKLEWTKKTTYYFSNTETAFVKLKHARNSNSDFRTGEYLRRLRVAFGRTQNLDAPLEIAFLLEQFVSKFYKKKRAFLSFHRKELVLLLERSELSLISSFSQWLIILQSEIHHCSCFTHSQINVSVLQVSTGISSGFWVMVDMLSGRFLYQNLKWQTQAKGDEVSSWLKLGTEIWRFSFRSVLKRRSFQHRRPSFELAPLVSQAMLFW